MEPMISAILLAAGISRRMGEDKLLLIYSGKSLLQRAVDLLSVLPVFEKFLVTTNERLGKIDIPRDVQVVINTDPEAGQSGSVKLGVSAAAGDRYLFLAADQPRLVPADLQQLIDSSLHYGNSIVYPVINGKPCSPSLFSAIFRAELLALSGDAGGRIIRAGHPEACIEITPERPENFCDIDSKEDYRRLIESTEILE